MKFKFNTNFDLRKQAILMVLCPWLFQLILTITLLPQLGKAQENLAQRLSNEETLGICTDLGTNVGKAAVLAATRNRSKIPEGSGETDFATIMSQVEYQSKNLIVKLRQNGYSESFVNKMERMNATMNETLEQFQSASVKAYPAQGLSAGGMSDATDMLMLTLGKLGRFINLVMVQEVESLRADQNQIHAEEQAWRRNTIIIVIAGLLVSATLSAYVIIKLFGELKALNEAIADFSSARMPRRKLRSKSELAALERTVYDMGKFTLGAIERNKALIDNASAMVCAVDGSQHFLTTNAYCSPLLGYEPEEICGRNLSDFVDQNELPRLAQLSKAGRSSQSSRAVATNSKASGEQQTFELRMKAADGSQRDTEWTTIWNPEETALFCVITDAGEKRQLERIKEDFLAMISHDLRTPLMSIVTGLATLNHARTAEREGFSQDVRVRLAEAESQITSLIVLVNNLLDFEKMQSGRTLASVGRVNLGNLIIKAVEEVEEKAENKQLSIEFSREFNNLRQAKSEPESKTETKTNRRTMVMADEALIAQLLGNILRLVVDLTNTRGANIVIDLGISGRDLELRIFAPLNAAKLENQTAKGKPETGVKLALEVCRLIARAHNRELKISSLSGGAETGQSAKSPAARAQTDDETCFSLSLPAANEF